MFQLFTPVENVYSDQNRYFCIKTYSSPKQPDYQLDAIKKSISFFLFWFVKSKGFQITVLELYLGETNYPNPTFSISTFRSSHIWLQQAVYPYGYVYHSTFNGAVTVYYASILQPSLPTQSKPTDTA